MRSVSQMKSMAEMVFQNLRIALKERTFLWCFDVLLNGDDALGFDHARENEEQAQKVFIVLLLPLGAGKDLPKAAHRAFDHIAAVRQQERSDRGAADHHHLEGKGLEDYAHLASGEDKPAENHGEDDHDPTDLKHARKRSPGPNPNGSAWRNSGLLTRPCLPNRLSLAS